jgi:hypothetical protein
MAGFAANVDEILARARDQFANLIPAGVAWRGQLGFQSVTTVLYNS